MKKITCLFILTCFILTGQTGICPGVSVSAYASEGTGNIAQELNLPAPGMMINLSAAYDPVMIKGLTIHKDNPFLFDFIIDVGQERMSGAPLRQEGEKLIKYFLAGLAVPDKDLWVNLSPYEKSRIVPQALGETDMGRDLLAQDYILKQITASLIDPEKDLGKKFWDRVYTKAQQMYGTTQVPINTFNKVWVMADKAEVFEHGQSVFVVGSHLKVMLQEDYLALKKHVDIGINEDKQTHGLSSEIVRQILLPELENEVNTGRNFANLRQIFNSIILSSWYKRNLKEALLNEIYADKSKVKGIDLDDPGLKEQIYAQYLKAYKKGVFNFIKEDNIQGQYMPRKYFSGGMEIVPTHIKDILNPVEGETKMSEGHWYGELDFQTGINTTSNNAMLAAADGANLTPDQKIIINEIARRYVKKFVNIGEHFTGKLIDNLDLLTTGLYNASFRPFYKLIEGILAEEEVRIQQGPPEFFDSLSKYGIKVDAVNYRDRIIIKRDLMQDNNRLPLIMVRQVGAMMGLAPSTINILANLANLFHESLTEDERRQIKEDMDATLKNQKRLGRSNVIPPLAVGLTLSSIIILDASNIDLQTKHNIAFGAHLLGAALLGGHLFAGLHQMVYGQIVTAALEGKPFESTRVGAYTSLVLGTLGAVVAPMAMMKGDPYLATAAIFGFGALAVHGLKRSYAGFFKGNTLRGVHNRYQEFFTNTAFMPALGAILLLTSGAYLTSLTGTKADFWLASAYFWFGKMFVDGVGRYTPKSFELAETSRRAAYEGKVTAELKKAVGDKMTNFILYSKPLWFLAFFDWMIIQPKKAGVLQPLLDHLNAAASSSSHPWAYYLTLTVAGAAIAGGLLIKDKMAERKATKELLKTAGLSENTSDQSDAAMFTPQAATKMNFTRGGIDLDTANQTQWKITKDGQGVEMALDPAMVHQLELQDIDGASPVIFKVTPIANIWSWAGIKAPALNLHSL